jgi:hypothetical protein
MIRPPSLLGALPVGAACALLAPAVAGACICGSPHASDGWQQRIDAYNANLVPGYEPLVRGVTFGTAAPRGSGHGVARFAPGGGTQFVRVEFDTAVPGVFSATEQQSVLDGLAGQFRGFDINFTTALNPNPGGEFTRLVFDDLVLGGVAVTGIDFRNIQSFDVAFVGTDGLQGDSSFNQVSYAVNVGAHEVGHTLGLRHYDSFGTIGEGVPNVSISPGFGQPPTAIANFYNPDFTGPRAGNEFFDNTMSTPALGGSALRFFDGPTAFSERSLMKLQHAATGIEAVESAASNNTLATAQALEMDFIDVLNTRPTGTAAADQGPWLPARTTSVAGSIASGDIRDVYQIDAFAGDLLSVEVISQALNAQRVGNAIDALLRVYDDTGTLLNYFGQSAFNQSEIETDDAFILDLLVPQTGSYFIEVDAVASFDLGNYELYVTGYGTGRTPGDANGDFDVNLADFGVLRANFGRSGIIGFSNGDFNGDGTVDLADFGILRANFGNTANLAAIDAWRATVPEPAALALLAATPLLLLRRRV